MKLPLQDDDGHVYFYGENLKSGMETDVGDVNSKNLFEKLKAVIKTIKSRVSSVSNMLSAMSDISKKMQEGALLKDIWLIVFQRAQTIRVNRHWLDSPIAAVED